MLRVVIVVALTFSVLAGAVWTAHWPIVGDAPLLHYVAFLIDHGKVPYRDFFMHYPPAPCYAVAVWFKLFGDGPQGSVAPSR